MTSTGQVRVWHDDEGWGVIDSADAPGGCWAGFSSVLVSGYRKLAAGQAVELLIEAADQDGYAFRAVEVWPSGQPPVRDSMVERGPSAAYGSSLSITWTSDIERDADPES